MTARCNVDKGSVEVAMKLLDSKPVVQEYVRWGGEEWCKDREIMEKTKLDLLLEEYAAGGSEIDAATIANHIKLKFAPACQPDPKKPDVYGPMQAVLVAALEAAERRGRSERHNEEVAQPEPQSTRVVLPTWIGGSK